MIELRYRIAAPPGMPFPLARWFDRAPEGRLHAQEVRFRDDSGEALFVADPSGAPADAFARDLVAAPPPGALLWDVGTSSEGELVVRARWREPMMRGIHSPMRVVADALGPEARSTLTVTRDGLVHRVLVPSEVDASGLWVSLRDAVERHSAAAGVPLLVEVERFAPHAAAGVLPLRVAQQVLAAALALGYYDSPPRASLQDVAVATGVPAPAVLAQLTGAERAILASAGLG